MFDVGIWIPNKITRKLVYCCGTGCKTLKDWCSVEMNNSAGRCIYVQMTCCLCSTIPRSLPTEACDHHRFLSPSSLQPDRICSSSSVVRLIIVVWRSSSQSLQWDFLLSSNTSDLSGVIETQSVYNLQQNHPVWQLRSARKVQNKFIKAHGISWCSANITFACRS